jgi:polyisoprenyl-phosphate glycosyltransferase
VQCTTSVPRAAGETKYPLRKMLAFAWTAATSFSIGPLQVSLYLSLAAALVGVEEGIRAVIDHFMGLSVTGWTSLMVVNCLIGGAILMCLAILGQYVGMIYEQSKQRPIYLVAHAFNLSPAPPDTAEAVGALPLGRA